MQDITLSPATTDSSVKSRSRDYGTVLPWQPTLASPAPPHGAAQPWQPTIPPPAPPPEESPPSSATTRLYDNSPLPAAKPNGVHTPTQLPPGSQPEDASSDKSRTRDYGSPPTVVVDSPLPVRRKVRFREDEPETAKESPLAKRTPATEASSSTSASSSSTSAPAEAISTTPTLPLLEDSVDETDVESPSPQPTGEDLTPEADT